jgi:hypothetical protein
VEDLQRCVDSLQWKRKEFAQTHLKKGLIMTKTGYHLHHGMGLDSWPPAPSVDHLDLCAAGLFCAGSPNQLETRKTAEIAKGLSQPREI